MRKNSAEKTMNSNFLAKVFSCPLFVDDYRKYMSTSILIKKCFGLMRKKTTPRKLRLWPKS